MINLIEILFDSSDNHYSLPPIILHYTPRTFLLHLLFYFHSFSSLPLFSPCSTIILIIYINLMFPLTCFIIPKVMLHWVYLIDFCTNLFLIILPNVDNVTIIDACIFVLFLSCIEY